jgi:hypothetical protein
MAKSKQDEYFEEGDDSLVIDMDNVEEQSFELLPKGVYDCVIEDCEYKLSNSSGKPMWSLTLVVTSGEFEGRKLFANMSFSEKALPMTKATIMKIAPDVLQAPFMPKKIADEGTLVGKNVRAKTKIEKYEGEERTRVANLMAPTGGFDEFTSA